MINEPWGQVVMRWVGTVIAAHDPLWHKAQIRPTVIRTGEGCRAKCLLG